MARPTKNNADYFSHDSDASMDEKVIYLESLFGLAGYALYFKMLEALARADDYQLQYSNIQEAILARKFGCDLSLFKEFIVAATTQEIACFTIENGVIFSKGLKKRLAPLDEKRMRDAERKRSIRGETPQKNEENKVVAATTKEIEATTPQSKVKESKVKENTSVFSTRDGFHFDSVEKFLDEHFGIVLNDSRVRHGAEKITGWLGKFEQMNLQNEWKNANDVRSHFLRFVNKQVEIEQKEHEIKVLNTKNQQNHGGIKSKRDSPVVASAKDYNRF